MELKMNFDEKLVRFIAKLNQLTQEDRLKWARVDPPKKLAKGINGPIMNFYYSKYEDKIIGVYEREYQTTYEERNLGVDILIIGFLDLEWNLEMEFADVTGLRDLYDSIRLIVSDLDKFFNKALQ